MFASLIRCGGYVWKFPPHITTAQRVNLKKRSLQVDSNIEAIYQGLFQVLPEKAKSGQLTNCKRVDYMKFEFPKYDEMSQRDKYFTFNRHAKNYRKAIHRERHWCKRSFRENPKYF